MPKLFVHQNCKRVLTGEISTAVALNISPEVLGDWSLHHIIFRSEIKPWPIWFEFLVAVRKQHCRSPEIPVKWQLLDTWFPCLCPEVNSSGNFCIIEMANVCDSGAKILSKCQQTTYPKALIHALVGGHKQIVKFFLRDNTTVFRFLVWECRPST